MRRIDYQMKKESTGTLILVRHAESEGNRDRRFTTSPAVGLTDNGRLQALSVADKIGRLYRPSRVLTSPYARARQTAEIIAQVLDLELMIEDGLREQSYGALAGQPYDAVFTTAGYDRERVWAWRPPGGESLQDVRKRVLPVFERLAAQHRGTEVVVVSHGGVMAAVRATLAGGWNHALVPPNAGIFLVRHSEGRLLTLEVPD
jgi:broad specificity phosphatase PhoE